MKKNIVCGVAVNQFLGLAGMAKRGNNNARTYRGFFHLPDALTAKPEFFSLSGKACKLLIDIGRQYNGHNNGDLSCTLSMLKSRGWNSNSQLTKSRNELLEAGLISQTKQGGLGIGPNLYAITWQAIDDCKGKLEVKSTTSPMLKLVG